MLLGYIKLKHQFIRINIGIQYYPAKVFYPKDDDCWNFWQATCGFLLIESRPYDSRDVQSFMKKHKITPYP